MIESESKPLPRCKTCGRVVWNGGHAISIDECHHPGGEICTLISQRNSLVAAVKKLAKARCDEATTKAVMAVVEEVSPTRNCPHCGRPDVVGPRQVINVHFINNMDKNPCWTSFKTVIGGMIFEKKS